ncbi:uncharacterized protein DSM5745_00341 [Aspergillus mulundensis]|uniref:Aromatic prenyltransferase n=1 Tax=Aspergillus mulundensis TaxID=1810919 RepID=A0A3D8T3B8_9EURO|nr:hypothetical protein DSM5745_00341 [Aspergillus mulundensis]RDW93019.1 hypothetical protein DSM5745_00341 [Aspergillus mulundensis]
MGSYHSTLYNPIQNPLSFYIGKCKETALPDPTSTPRQLSVYQQVSTKLNESFDPHATYWWQTSGRFLAGLLEDAGYTTSAQEKILTFFSRTITPFMGPARISAREPPQWRSFMTDDHYPIELSWDFPTGRSAPRIRFSIEPLSVSAGTSMDPYNTDARSAFLEALLRALPNTDLETFRHFERALIPRHAVSKEVLEEVQGHPSTIFYGFDLDNSEITTKAYFFPGLKAQQTNCTNPEVVARVIATAPQCSPNQLHALRTFNDFVREHDTAAPNTPLEIDMLAIDLVAPTSSRVKIYFRTRETSFSSVRQMMTLGQRLPALNLHRLRLFWDVLLNQAGVPDERHLPGSDTHRTAGLIYNVELRWGSAAPKVKIYIPVRHYADSDEVVLDAVHRYTGSASPDREIVEGAWGYADTMRREL